MSNTLIDPTAIQVISGTGIALCSVTLLVGVALIFRVKGNVSRAVLSDTAFYPMMGVFLTTAVLWTATTTFDVAMLAGLLGILSTMGLTRVIPHGRH